MNLAIRSTLRESSKVVSSLNTFHSNGRPSMDVNVFDSESRASAVKLSGESSKYRWVVVCFILIECI
ncbi:hypothetical protein BpHYR1_013764 [Brachionus plicatilis]|uniref:Uncharacterized protein n=1 Tax=Brachionus plicatilis TaxID=10195 RepID=A0A3M7RAF7_BRAPC|nr:hypothetical protein BpHYR1_013764 [Brachionus plicatilis]